MIQGQLDVPLDDTGREQAIAAASALAATLPYAVVSSDLSRALDTARLVAAAAGLPVAVDQRLRELDLGSWQGLTSEQARDSHPDEHADWRAGVDVRRGGGETYAEAGARAMAAMLSVDLPPGRTLVAVTHGGTARAAVAALLELPPEHAWRLAALGNCCWSVLVEADRGWRLERHGAEVGSPAGPPAGGHDLGARPAPTTL